MGRFYMKGEKKDRPGLYQRYENRGQNPVASAMVGYCAIVIQADWGPLNTVSTFTESGDALVKLYGSGGTVADALKLFEGGATTVHVCRIGKAGKAASVKLSGGSDEIVQVDSLYPGTREFAVSIQEILGDTTKKKFVVSEGSTALETIEFAAGENEGAALVDAVAKYKSAYVTVSMIAAATDGVLAPVLQAAMTGGQNPTVVTEDYSAGFNELETVEWNTISTDTDDNAVHALLATFMERVYKSGKCATCVVGDPTTVSLKTRLQNAANFDSEMVNYFGGVWIDKSGNKVEGHLAVNQVAGIIASTPSNKSITHATIKGAVDIPEKLTNEQYIQAIQSGCLLLSMSPDKQVWFDSGVNTLIHLADNQDEGWKKIKRVAIRNELMNRIDKTVAKKVGRVNNDSDGQADVMQAGQNVLNTMVAEGGKILAGASFYLDAKNPPQGDEAWFVIDADDIDALEKIYLLYRFRYSQLS